MPEMPERRENCKLHEDKISRIDKKVDAIYKILVGNGQIGICSKVDIMWGVMIFIITGVSITVGTLLWGMIVS